MIFVVSIYLDNNENLVFSYFLDKFDLEKRNLVDELDMLRRARDTFEQEKQLRDQELRQYRDRSRASSDELKNALAKVQILEQQVSFLQSFS